MLASPEMSETGRIVPGMTEPPICHDITITVDRDGGRLPDPAEFAIAAEQAGSARAASVMSAHTAEQIISIVTVEASDRPAGCRHRPGGSVRSASFLVLHGILDLAVADEAIKKNPAKSSAVKAPVRQASEIRRVGTMLSTSFAGGVSIKEHAEYLDHSDLAFTVRVYAHMLP